MPENQPNRRELATYYALAQVGMEMVVPVGVGMLLDYYLDWTPWGVVVGAVLGLIVGITQLVTISNRMNQKGQDQREQGSL